jgi:hypothetical protein
MCYRHVLEYDVPHSSLYSCFVKQLQKTQLDSRSFCFLLTLDVLGISVIYSSGGSSCFI